MKKYIIFKKFRPTNNYNCILIFAFRYYEMRENKLINLNLLINNIFVIELLFFFYLFYFINNNT